MWIPTNTRVKGKGAGVCVWILWGGAAGEFLARQSKWLACHLQKLSAWEKSEPQTALCCGCLQMEGLVLRGKKR